MANINHVVISGNLTRDPEIRTTTGGTAVLSFSVAVNDSRMNKQTGQWEDVPNFLDCTMFGKRAESLNNFMRKGMKVTVSGKLHQSSWEKDGQKRSKVDIIVEEVELPPRQQTPARSDYAQPDPQVQQGFAAIGVNPIDVYAADNIPF